MSNHGILLSEASEAEVKAVLCAQCPDLHLLSAGRLMDVYKDIGHPADISQRYDFNSLRGSHCVGHTRMATESAVTPVHSHPFVAGEDFCLVHNGSLSNHHSLRRKLEGLGIEFETDNDTEAVCRFLEWRMREGDTIEGALDRAFAEVDGFYTLLIGTADRIVLVRDAFACKPAVVAETTDYVAIGSEFRTLAHLPGIGDANLFEPGPEEIYSWKV
jgi:glutamate synthase domain-containing protein 1